MALSDHRPCSHSIRRPWRGAMRLLRSLHLVPIVHVSMPLSWSPDPGYPGSGRRRFVWRRRRAEVHAKESPARCCRVGRACRSEGRLNCLVAGIDRSTPAGVAGTAPPPRRVHAKESPAQCRRVGRACRPEGRLNCLVAGIDWSTPAGLAGLQLARGARSCAARRARMRSIPDLMASRAMPFCSGLKVAYNASHASRACLCNVALC